MARNRSKHIQTIFKTIFKLNTEANRLEILRPRLSRTKSAHV